MIQKQMKDLAWNTFKQTGNINSYLEFKEVKNIEESKVTKQELRRKSAEVVSTSIFIYVASVAFIMVAIPVLKMNPIIVTAIFLCAIAWATARIVKNYMSMPKFDKTKEEIKEEKILKQINGIVNTVCTVIYFIVSFMTMAWHITWIIFLIGSAIQGIIHAIFELRK